jgi:hypothetical protein
LKKQSQFSARQNGAISYMERGYGNITSREAGKNKANQSQFTRIKCCVLGSVN